MVLKRKRSDSEISSCSGSTLSSPPPSNSMGSPFPSFDQHQYVGSRTPAHLSSRTRKRYRDNRPSDSLIHQHTLSMLYAAQKQPEVYPVSSEANTTPRVVSAGGQQSSLHSFWALPPRSSSCDSNNTSSSASSPPTSFSATNCDDCDAELMFPDGDVMDIDVGADMIEGCATTNHACSKCGKQVCRQCAVSNLGDQRQCLICAGSRRWVGGIGWVDQA